MRLEHADPESQQVMRENWAEMGMVTKHIGEAKEKAEAARTSPTVGPLGKKKAEVRTRSLAAIEPHIEDKPLTLEGATQARVQRTREARQRAKKQGTWTDPHTGWEMPALPEGTAWYFGHHADIAAAAREHGIDKRKAIVATTSMSPNNNPESEKKAGRAMLDMVGHQDKHTVLMTPELHARANQKIAGRDLKGTAMPKSWIGQHVSLADMDSKHIAGVASVAAEMREEHKQPIQSTANFEDVGAARQAGAAHRAIEHLRGQRSEDETIDPHSAPKVWSYKQSTLESVPGSDQHFEYIARAQDYQRGGQRGLAEGGRIPKGMHEETLAERVERMAQRVRLHEQAAKGDPLARSIGHLGLGALGLRRHPTGQVSLPDYRPLRRSQEGTLSPDTDTAEDTWMHAITTRQDPRSVKTEGGSARSATSIAKTVATDPDLASEKRMTKSSPTSEAKVSQDARIKNAALNHAMNNFATRTAAKIIGKGRLPARFVQEVPWTEQRIRAEKAPEFKKKQATEDRIRTGIAKQPPPLGRQYPTAPRNPVTPIHHAASKALYDQVVGGTAATPEQIAHVEQLRSHAAQ